MKLVASIGLASALLCASTAHAQIAVSSNDRKVFLADDGNLGLRPVGTGNDTATVFDLGVTPPRVIAEIDDVPGSVIGPPSNVAVSPDQTLAVIASSMKRDPSDANRQVADDRLTLVDLAASPPRKIDTIRAGRQPSGVAFSPDGRLVLVANHGDGTISVFRVEGHKLLPLEGVVLGNENAGPFAVAFTVDGRHALVTRYNDNLVTVLDVDGAKVTASPRHMGITQSPYPLAVNPDGRTAFFGSNGAASGANLDAGVIGVIDLTRQPYRVTRVYAVAPIVENVVVSPDGAYVAAISHNGSGVGIANPLFRPNGILTVFKVEGTTLRQIAEQPIGRWPQGAAFNFRNELMVQSAFAQQAVMFRVQGDQVAPMGAPIPLPVTPVALRTADLPRPSPPRRPD